jgi:hypothetical protein
MNADPTKAPHRVALNAMRSRGKWQKAASFIMKKAWTRVDAYGIQAVVSKSIARVDRRQIERARSVA